MDKQVQQGDTVAIHYTGKLPDDTVFDSSQGRDPFSFVAGGKEVIPGMSQGVIGMKVGEHKTLTMPPEDAYGDRDDDLIIRVPSERLPEEVSEGDLLGDSQDPTRTWQVRQIEGDSAVLDGNHPLAGHTLVFEVELVDIT